MGMYNITLWDQNTCIAVHRVTVHTTAYSDVLRQVKISAAGSMREL